MNINDDSIEIIEEYLNSARTNAICHQLATISEKVWCISLRKCSVNDSNSEKLMKSIKKCKSVRYLNFNLSIINSLERLSYFTANIISHFPYLDTLSLHSSNLRDEGLKLLYYSLVNLKHFRSLDIGDCQLTDSSLIYVRELIHRRKHIKGLSELVISANSQITPIGLTGILIAVAASTDLRYFHMDYNKLDDCCGFLLVAILSANHSLEVLDLEHTGVGNETALLLIYLIRNYPLSIKTLNLMNNPINREYLAEIHQHVPNEYGLDTSFANGFKKTEGEANLNNTTNTVNQAAKRGNFYDIRIRDQNKLEQFISKASKLSSRELDDFSKSEYVKALERDYNAIRQRYERAIAAGQLQELEENKLAETKKKEEELKKKQQEEIISPFDDLRYKAHNILPFNIKSY